MDLLTAVTTAADMRKHRDDVKRLLGEEWWSARYDEISAAITRVMEATKSDNHLSAALRLAKAQDAEIVKAVVLAVAVEMVEREAEERITERANAATADQD